jgi:hypothetical protein
MASTQGKKIITCHDELEKKLRTINEGNMFLRNAINRTCDRLSHSYQEVKAEIVTDIKQKKLDLRG